MNRVLVVFSDGLLSQLDSERGLIPRSAWIRQAVEDKLTKEPRKESVKDSPAVKGPSGRESGSNGVQAPPAIVDTESPSSISQMKAVAPLVPAYDGFGKLVTPTPTADQYEEAFTEAFKDAAESLTPEEHEILTKAWSPNEFDAHKAKPVPQLSVEGEPLNEYEMATGYRQEPKPKARRKKKGEVGNPSVSLVDALTASVEAKKAQAPARCNRGACPGTIHPRTGSCNRCMQKPLKESK